MKKNLNRPTFIVLASQSPRRRDLLRPYFALRIISPKIDESQREGESPLKYVKRISLQKWKKAAEKIPSGSRSAVLLAADTIVVHKNRILGKPKNAKEAQKILRSLSGQKHDVLTAVAVGKKAYAPRFHFSVRTRVQFIKLGEAIIENYIRSGEWKDKAGAYAIQGIASSFVAELQGSLTNIVGLPVIESVRALVQSGAQPRLKTVK